MTMLRHLGHAMILILGPATVFTTVNYPDVRTGFVALLDDGPEPPGKSPAVDLLRDDPAVPSVVELHRILARNPVAGARYFLLMQELYYRHGMGFDRLWFGCQSVAIHRFGDREDGYACSTQPCIGGPLKSGAWHRTRPKGAVLRIAMAKGTALRTFRLKGCGRCSRGRMRKLPLLCGPIRKAFSPRRAQCNMTTLWSWGRKCLFQ